MSIETENCLMESSPVIIGETQYPFGKFFDEEQSHPSSEMNIQAESLPASETKEEFAKTDRVGRKMYFGLYVPEDWDISTFRGVKEIKMKDIKVIDEQTGELRTITIDVGERICSSRIMPIGRFISVDDDGENIIMIRFIDKSTDKTIYAPQSAIQTKAAFIQHLLPKNVRVEESNLKSFFKYMNACIDANESEAGSEFITGYVYNVNGWKDDKYTKFVSGNRLFCEKMVNGKPTFQENKCVFIDSENNDSVRKLATVGNLTDWVKSVSPVIKYPRLRFVCYKEFDIMLVELLGSKPCTIGFQSKTSVGKTLTEMITASQIGDPDERKGLIITGDISIAALHANLRSYRHHTVHIDETTNMKDDVLKVIAYIATNGQEPERSTKTGKLRGQKLLCSNVMVTSENDIISDRASDGAEVRSIISDKSTIDVLDQSIIRKIESGIKSNYGHILPRFLNKISEHRNELCGWYEAAITRLQNTTHEIQQKRQASYYAAAEVAGKLLEEVYQDIGIDPVNPQNIVDQMWDECVLNNLNKPLHIKALESVYSFYISHSHKHFVKGETKPTMDMGEIYGWDFPNYIDFNQETLKRALKESDFDKPNAIIKQWKENGIIETNLTANVKTANHYESAKSETTTQMGVYRILKSEIYECTSLKDPKSLSAADRTDAELAAKKIIESWE